MLESITFKTELNEILTVEEVAMLFDNVYSQNQITLISLSLFPLFNQIRKDIIQKAANVHNQELSKLLSEIYNKKRAAKINIWQVLGAMGQNKKRLEEKLGNSIDLKQILYEEEQIIKAYENSIKSLDIKEKKILTGKYSRTDRIVSIKNINILNKQIKKLKEIIMNLSKQHNNCFDEFEEKLNELIDGTIITWKIFPKNKFPSDKKDDDNDDSDDDGNMHYTRISKTKEYYQYEPIEADDDDELIFQLLSQGSYNQKDGTINGLSVSNEELEPEY